MREAPSPQINRLLVGFALQQYGFVVDLHDVNGEILLLLRLLSLLLPHLSGLLFLHLLWLLPLPVIV